ncbi:NAD-dependent epimerase/dehydratase family protein [Cycloclasticus pugetii]|jgi:nucleoside-diphosphate-sugar epimerase|uniref:NAD-dependent epimerase/dehydratase family protein n=1 Tax=Cycloclasticus pugetii TaxID=34068 RepID=UPI0009185077|nr:NAD-dependent epimerase/dehydratase family protein [Cycloclasticus pugetii]SHJ39855.1 Nucleoside-diphosphate-sugar epimerase [Cycloclasticus pugetii]
MPDETILQKKRVLITGASGFIGARLVEKLSTVDNYFVTALVRDARKVEQLIGLSEETVVTDLSNRQGIEQVVKGSDIVINLAYDFKSNKQKNLQAFTNLHDACIKHRVKKFVQVSSIVVYDGWPTIDIDEKSSSNPSGLEDYRDTKISIEQLLDISSANNLLHTTVLQPTIVYGPNSWLWTDAIVEKLSTGTLILPSNCKGVCNAVYVDDVVDALLLAIEKTAVSGEKYIISGPEPITWKHFYEGYNKALKKDSIVYVNTETLSTEQSTLTWKIKKIIANPFTLSNWKVVQYFLKIIDKLFGSEGIKKIKYCLQRLKKSGGKIVYYPTEDEIELYCSTGICSTSQAKDKLGYEPTRDFNTGFKITTSYINEKYSLK